MHSVNNYDYTHQLWLILQPFVDAQWQVFMVVKDWGVLMAQL